jgi:hypothetical protein
MSPVNLNHREQRFLFFDKITKYTALPNVMRYKNPTPNPLPASDKGAEDVPHKSGKPCNWESAAQRVRKEDAQRRMLFFTVGVQGALKFKS